MNGKNFYWAELRWQKIQKKNEERRAQRDLSGVSGNKTDHRNIQRV